jgi:flagellar biosynthetic protein FliO
MSTMRACLLLCLMILAPLVAAEPNRVPVARPATVPVATASNDHQAPLFTDAEWNRSQNTAAGVPDGGASIAGRAALSLVLSLVAVIAVAVLLAWLVKKFGVKRMLPGKGRHLEIIETVPVGFKRSVSLMRIGNQILVVGQGEHELNHLATLPLGVLDLAPAETIAAAPAAESEPVTAPPSAFRSCLERLMGKHQ